MVHYLSLNDYSLPKSKISLMGATIFLDMSRDFVQLDWWFSNNYIMKVTAMRI